MNPGQLTQKLEQAAQAWQDETQSALQRALLVDVMAHPDRAKRWEAIRFAIEQQSDELRKLRAGASVDVDGMRQSWRRDLASALGELEPNKQVPRWHELVSKVRELRGIQSRNIAAHTEGRDAAKESDRGQLAEALGLPGITWTDLLTCVRQLRAENTTQAVDLVRWKERGVAEGRVAKAEQRAADAQELREALGVLESAIATDEQINRANLAALNVVLGLPDGAGWDVAINRVRRWRDRYAELCAELGVFITRPSMWRVITEVRRLRYAAAQMVDAFGELSVSAADEKSMKAYRALSGQIRRLQTRPDASATVDMCAQAEAGTPK